jgi:hypothetical protein
VCVDLKEEKKKGQEKDARAGCFGLCEIRLFASLFSFSFLALPFVPSSLLLSSFPPSLFIAWFAGLGLLWIPLRALAFAFAFAFAFSVSHSSLLLFLLLLTDWFWLLFTDTHTDPCADSLPG